MPKPSILRGSEATERVFNAKYAEQEANVQEDDPMELKKGAEIEIWPLDTGINHRDSGQLVGINEQEIVVELPSKPRRQEIRLHCPRTNFRIRSVSGDKSKL